MKHISWQHLSILLQGMLAHRLLNPSRKIPYMSMDMSMCNTDKHMSDVQDPVHTVHVDDAASIDLKHMSDVQDPVHMVLETQGHTAPDDAMDTDTHTAYTTLADIRQVLAQVQHPLRYLSNLVFSDIPAPICVIGEAPGEQEDQTGLPFVGASGKLLMQAFDCIDLKRDRDLYITNIVPFRPPANRTPTAQEVEFFLPFVIAQIKLLKPKLIVLVGSVAYKALATDSSTISQARGQFMQVLGHDAIAVFHPSYLLRNYHAKPLMWQDMISIAKFLART